MKRTWHKFGGQEMCGRFLFLPVERYHKIHELSAKQVDVANIARQVGLSRQAGL